MHLKSRHHTPVLASDGNVGYARPAAKHRAIRRETLLLPCLASPPALLMIEVARSPHQSPDIANSAMITLVLLPITIVLRLVTIRRD